MHIHDGRSVLIITRLAVKTRHPAGIANLDHATSVFDRDGSVPVVIRNAGTCVPRMRWRSAERQPRPPAQRAEFPARPFPKRRSGAGALCGRCMRATTRRAARNMTDALVTRMHTCIPYGSPGATHFDGCACLHPRCSSQTWRGDENPRVQLTMRNHKCT